MLKAKNVYWSSRNIIAYTKRRVIHALSRKEKLSYIIL
jgi:hypothetical protein